MANKLSTVTGDYFSSRPKKKKKTFFDKLARWKKNFFSHVKSDFSEYGDLIRRRAIPVTYKSGWTTYAKRWPPRFYRASTQEIKEPGLLDYLPYIYDAENNQLYSYITSSV